MERSRIKYSNRIHVLGIPIDVIALDDLEKKADRLLGDGKVHQVIFINTLDILRARRNREFRSCVTTSSLVIPTAKGILRSARFLQKPVPHRHMPFEFVIHLLGALEKKQRSLFLVGQKEDQLRTVENNLRASFPQLRIVGRYVGYYPKEIHEDIILAIKKASPSLLLAGRGLLKNNLWIHQNRENFNPGIFIWCGECYDIFSGKKERPSKKAWESGIYKLGTLFSRPWRILRIFVYLYYGFLLIIHRIGKK